MYKLSQTRKIRQSCADALCGRPHDPHNFKPDLWLFELKVNIYTVGHKNVPLYFCLYLN